jgi:hypothetical protein
MKTGQDAPGKKTFAWLAQAAMVLGNRIAKADKITI